MLTVKVGVMPGRLVEVAVQEGLSAREIFDIAGVEIQSNHEIRLDGNKIDINNAITGGNLLVAMKMIKGNTKTIKCGIMPGRLVEVAYEDGMSAKQIFDLAGVEIASNHEIRLDGNKINVTDGINNGGLLVAMKMIKGNSQLKVGQMPGRLETIELTQPTTARDIFAQAGVEIQYNHEVRLDGNKITLDTVVENGNLLVAMKMIKGNGEAYVSELSLDEIYRRTECTLPQKLDASKVEFLETCVYIAEHWTVETEVFKSVYTLVDVQEEHVCECTQVKERYEGVKKHLEDRIERLERARNHHRDEFNKYETLINELKQTLRRM